MSAKKEKELDLARLAPPFGSPSASRHGLRSVGVPAASPAKGNIGVVGGPSGLEGVLERRAVSRHVRPSAIVTFFHRCRQHHIALHIKNRLVGSAYLGAVHLPRDQNSQGLATKIMVAPAMVAGAEGKVAAARRIEVVAGGGSRWIEVVAGRAAESQGFDLRLPRALGGRHPRGGGKGDVSGLKENVRKT